MIETVSHKSLQSIFCLSYFNSHLIFLILFNSFYIFASGMWTTALKALPLASQETSAAMEFYHNQLKLRFLNEKDPSVYQRSDWLVDKLATKVHSYFWLDEYAGKDDFARYSKDEWASGLTPRRKSLQIPDSNVIIEGKFAKVIDNQDSSAHIVLNHLGSEFALCDCSWAHMGNLCEHVFKVTKVLRNKGSARQSISMRQFNKALIDMLKCPPHDSLIHDHAVSLAAWVQMQLNARVDIESDPNMADRTDKDMVHENCCTNDSKTPSHTANGELSGDFVANENGTCGERGEGEISCAEMEADPPSICTSGSGLFAGDGTVSKAIFMENGGRELINTGPDITKDLPSTDDSFKNLNGFEEDILEKDCHESMMDVDSESVIHQNGVCSNNAESSVIPRISNENPEIDNSSLSISSH